MFARKVVDYISVSNIVSLYTCGSNEFFKQIHQDKQFDVIFIDGDHSYTQSKIDLENSLKHLANNGIIIIDDVNTTTQALTAETNVYRTFKEYKGRKQLFHDMGIIYGKSNEISLLD